jgi:hypothetical protein
MNKIYERMAEFLLEAESVEDDPKRNKAGMGKEDADKERSFKFVMQSKEGLSHILNHGHKGWYDDIAHMPGVAGLITRSYNRHEKRNPDHPKKIRTHEK